MKNFILFAVLTWVATFNTSCHKHHHDEGFIPVYSIEIVSPGTDDKKVGDTVPVEIKFIEADGGTVHHINIRIFKKDDTSVEILNEPAEAHVHEDGSYTYKKDLVLATVSADTDYVLEAKVWGEADDAEVTSKTVEFHVHPN